MECSFGEKYKVLLVEGNATDAELKLAFEMIYTEYVENAGLYITREFEMQAYIHTMDIRVNTIYKFIELQKEFIQQFNLPFIPGFALVKKYGHNLYWDFNFPNTEEFLKRLDSIGVREKRYVVELEHKKNELFEFVKKRLKKEHSILQTRKEFISMLNRLQQNHFVIDKEKTTVEDLAIMIRDSKDEVEAQKAQAAFKRK